MVSEYKEGNCNRCIHYARLTAKEVIVLSPHLRKLNLDPGKIKGACMRPVLNPNLIIRSFLSGDETGCFLFEKGFYREKLGVTCPSCQKGKMVITRPLINGHPVIMIACNRYPDCKHWSKSIQLSTGCRTCGTMLELRCGEILEVVCPKCERPLEIPVSPRIWPALIKPSGGCVHTGDNSPCVVCDRSRNERKSLLELETPDRISFMHNAPSSFSHHAISDLLEDDSEGAVTDFVAYATDGKYNRDSTRGIHWEDSDPVNEDEVLEVIEERSDFAAYYQDLLDDYGDDS